MKQKFNKDFKNWRTVALILCLFLLLIATFSSEHRRNFAPFFLLYLPLAVTYFRKYTIEEDDTLTGNGEIPIEQITKIVYEPRLACQHIFCEPSWVTIYYVETKDGKTKIRKFYPKDAEDFIHSLTDINPDIQVI